VDLHDKESIMAVIAVTGASGKLGRATVGFLLERKLAPESLVVVVRDPQKVADFSARGVEVRRGDYTDPASLQAAFSGVDKLLFISSSALGESVSYKSVTSDEFRTALEAKGLPAPAVEMSVALGEAIRDGEFDAGSTDLQGLLGRAPVTLEAFLRQALASK
jgi:uncharacterized protein YbjT (DUF2867 family)